MYFFRLNDKNKRDKSKKKKKYAKIDMAPMGHHGMKNFTGKAIGTN